MIIVSHAVAYKSLGWLVSINLCINIYNIYISPINNIAMPLVKFTANLKRFYPTLDVMQVNASTVADVLAAVEARHEGIRDYIVDEQGALRKHVNIFIGNEMVQDREKLNDHLAESDEVYIMQALSGG